MQMYLILGGSSMKFLVSVIDDVSRRRARASEQVSSRVRITNLDKAKVRHYNMIRMDSVSVSFFEFY